MTERLAFHGVSNNNFDEKGERQMKDQLATDVTDRFIGCLLGGAVGDALALET